MSVEDADWVDAVMSTMKMPDVSSLILPGSLWVSKRNGRRGKVRWSNPSETLFTFADGATSQCLYKTDKFLALYDEV